MRRLALALGIIVIAGCTGHSTATASPSPHSRATATPTPAPTATPTLEPAGALHLSTTTYVSGLEVPWSIVFMPDGDALVTERAGRVRLIHGGQLQANPVLTLSVKAASGVESGLLGIALHPGFPNPADVYVYYTRASANVNRISRFTYANGQLANEQVVYDNIPGGTCCHFGGRIGFGPDGKLYATVGDGQVPCRAVDTGSPNGKVLRLNDDGSIPSDNPFAGSPVWAYGLRNPEGLAWDLSGRLYVTNNGPTGEYGLYHNDEIDYVQKGQFYGWPHWAGTTHTSSPCSGPTDRSAQPVAASGNDTTWAPSGATFFRPVTNQQPTLLVATLYGQALRRFIVDPANPGTATGQEVVLSGYGRLRDAVAGPDSCVYVLTSNRDGRGTPQSGDDKVLRACPA